MENAVIPYRQIRAAYTESTITVYQAYAPEIAEPALRAGRFVAPFKLERMTWIKPSFLWMMYRCGWATKAGQERVLAIEIMRDGFEWALAHSSLSHFDPTVYATAEEFEQRKNVAPVRVQWDPERSLVLGEMPYRSIQIGIGGEAVLRYVADWTVGISDVTAQARHLDALV